MTSTTVGRQFFNRGGGITIHASNWARVSAPES